ncbi:hypothetical protein [Caballeronia calidae]|uniref:hypothetical protein n=1 Tax=Caballeronia calidae TaxID=1777139 RepID=UPI0007878437
MIEIGTVVAVMVSAYSIEFMAIIAATFVLYSVWTFIFTRYRMRFQRAVGQPPRRQPAQLRDREVLRERAHRNELAHERHRDRCAGASRASGPCAR